MNSAYDTQGGQFVTVSEATDNLVAIQKYAYCLSFCRFLCAANKAAKLSAYRLRLSLCGLWWSC